jgi:hypothetical protein
MAFTYFAAFNAESDEPSRFAIQLYHRTATQVDLSANGCWRSVAATVAAPRTSSAPCAGLLYGAGLEPGRFPAADAGPDRPLAAVPVAHRPRIQRRERQRVLPRIAMREVFVPDVLLR